MKEQLGNYFKELPSWAKGVVVVGGLVVIYSVYRSISNRIKSEAAKKKLLNNKSELKDRKDRGEVSTYSKSQFDGWANSLVQQFSGCDVEFTPFGLSTSGQMLYDIASRLYTDVDFLELVDSYGTRTYDECGWWTGDLKDFTLQESVTSELSDTEIGKINTKLASNGLTYQF